MTTTITKRRSYRRRTARSLCRKKDGKKCLRIKGCKPTRKTMKRKSYCRKSKKHLVKGGGETISSEGQTYLIGKADLSSYLEKLIDKKRNPANIQTMGKDLYMYDTTNKANAEMKTLEVDSYSAPTFQDNYEAITVHEKNDTSKKYYVIRYFRENNTYNIYDLLRSQKQDTKALAIRSIMPSLFN